MEEDATVKIRFNGWSKIVTIILAILIHGIGLGVWVGAKTSKLDGISENQKKIERKIEKLNDRLDAHLDKSGDK